MKNTNMKQTYFDTLVTNEKLQLAKAVIPYIGKRERGFLAIYIKLIELQNAVKYATSPKLSGSLSSDAPTDISGLLNDLKDYLDDGTVETLEMMMSLMEMMKENPEANEEMFGNYMDMFKDML